MSRLRCHIPPDKNDIEWNKLVEPLGEQIRAELTEMINRYGISTLILDTEEHCVDIDIIKLPPDIKEVLTRWGAIFVRDNPPAPAAARSQAPTPPAAPAMVRCKWVQQPDKVWVCQFCLGWTGDIEAYRNDICEKRDRRKRSRRAKGRRSNEN